MKKIPTLFRREFENHKIKRILPEVTEGMDWVLRGEGEATVKFDGSCCAVINGELYKRYDAKNGKRPPEGAIPCCDPDPVTGHWPHWVKCERSNPSDRWFWEAFDNTTYFGDIQCPEDGTYEAVGKHFNGNPHALSEDSLIRHGTIKIARSFLSFDEIKWYLLENEIEGIVFWKDGEPQCKIKRSDFGFKWPVN